MVIRCLCGHTFESKEDWDAHLAEWIKWPSAIHERLYRRAEVEAVAMAERTGCAHAASDVFDRYPGLSERGIKMMMHVMGAIGARGPIEIDGVLAGVGAVESGVPPRGTDATPAHEAADGRIGPAPASSLPDEPLTAADLGLPYNTPAAEPTERPYIGDMDPADTDEANPPPNLPPSPDELYAMLKAEYNQGLQAAARMAREISNGLSLEENIKILNQFADQLEKKAAE